VTPPGFGKGRTFSTLAETVMNIPKDSHEADRVGMVRVARILSNIISPPIMFAITGLMLGLYERPIWPGLAWGALYGLLIALSPMLVVAYMLRSGRITDMHMSATHERHIPYLTSVIAGSIAFVIILLFDGPVLLRCLTVLSVIALGALGLINTRWLISIHATAGAATWLIFTLVFGWRVGLILLPFLVLVAWIRLYLKRHTVPQVLAGIALGISLVLLMRAFGCFAL
jgi:membrane-associated phospholipid phosphatase